MEFLVLGALQFYNALAERTEHKAKVEEFMPWARQVLVFLPYSHCDVFADQIQEYQGTIVDGLREVAGMGAVSSSSIRNHKDLNVIAKYLAAFGDMAIVPAATYEPIRNAHQYLLIHSTSPPLNTPVHTTNPEGHGRIYAEAKKTQEVVVQLADLKTVALLTDPPTDPVLPTTQVWLHAHRLHSWELDESAIRIPD
ncbi:hypothetical protein DFS33DRAFT_1377753 [Desarmillaria ectypa]|nr:hypothetical protein DFS33DRAFT_1377753 [Desarmillaria ectypa]